MPHPLQSPITERVRSCSSCVCPLSGPGTMFLFVPKSNIKTLAHSCPIKRLKMSYKCVWNCSNIYSNCIDWIRLRNRVINVLNLCVRKLIINVILRSYKTTSISAIGLLIKNDTLLSGWFLFFVPKDQCSK